MTLPRPDLSSALGIAYRRIPLLAHGNDVYADTRLILQHLDASIPFTVPTAFFEPLPDSLEARAIQALLQKWVVETSVFSAAAALIPANSPVFENPAFIKDREDLTGRSWKKENLLRGRADAAVGLRGYFAFLEETLLGDGRKWILATEKPTRADLEAVWVPNWAMTMKGALDEEVFGKERFPKVYAFVERFMGLVKEAKAHLGKMERVDGKPAAERILGGTVGKDIGVDQRDPLALKKGTEVEIGPTDWGYKHKDRGILVGLSGDEVVIEKNVIAGRGERKLKLHFPRTGFRISEVQDRASL